MGEFSPAYRNMFEFSIYGYNMKLWVYKAMNENLSRNCCHSFIYWAPMMYQAQYTSHWLNMTSKTDVVIALMEPGETYKCMKGPQAMSRERDKLRFYIIFFKMWYITSFNKRETSTRKLVWMNSWCFFSGASFLIYLPLKPLAKGKVMIV